MKTFSLALAALLALSIPGSSSQPEKAANINLVVYDISADRPVADTKVEVVVFSDCASDAEIYRSSALTGKHGEFLASLPVGQRLVSVALPGGESVRGCVGIESKQDIERCGSRLSQSLFVRMTIGDRRLPADILDNNPCAATVKSVCEPLNFPHTVSSMHVVFAEEEGRPLANATLEFSKWGKGGGEIFGSITTDSKGYADLSPIYAHPRAAGSGVNVVIANSQSFVLRLSRTPNYEM